MSNPVWPADLPQTLQIQGHTYGPGDNRVVSQMDAGPVKMRRRFTAVPEAFSGVMTMTKAQLETFRAFYVSTLQGGTLRFDWRHPVTGLPAEVRFDPNERPPWRAQAVAVQTWEVSLAIEVLP